MLGAAASALSQMLSPPFRAVLLKSAGAALVLLVVAGVALQRLLAALVQSGGGWLDATFQGYHGAIGVVEFALAVLAGLGVVAGLVFLMPAVTALVASVFADEIAAEVERTHYPADPPGTALPVARAMWEGVKTALFALLIYLCAVPFLLVAGLGAVIFFFATAFLLGREYFELAAMRFHSPAEARALRKRHAGTVFVAGMIVAAFVSIPIVNLATPLFATAFMVHMHKRLSGPRRITIEATR
jgi:uncharacterized protein involved in cysteine biosynthesis